MERMEFKDFINAVQMRLAEKLGNGSRVVVRRADKASGGYTGITMRTQGSIVSPMLSLEELYGYYEDGCSIGVIVEAMAEMFQSPMPEFDVSLLTDYNRWKEMLYLKLVPAEGRDEELSKFPHRRIGDMALTVALGKEDEEGRLLSVSVSHEMLAAMGVSEGTLFEDAFRYAPVNMPPLVMSLDEITGSAIEGAEDLNTGMTVVTNHEYRCGAAVMLNPGLLNGIADKEGCSLLIFASSINETIICPDDGRVDHETAASIVRAVNREALLEREFLSDHVYRYDRESGELAQM